MAGGDFNLWLESLSGTDHESPEEGIARIFRVSPERARVLLRRLPCTVKRNVTREEAVRVGEALISIGGLVRLDRAGTESSAQTQVVAPSLSPTPLQPAAPGQPSTAATLKLGTLEQESGHEALRPQHLEVERTADPQPVALYAGTIETLDIERSRYEPPLGSHPSTPESGFEPFELESHTHQDAARQWSPPQTAFEPIEIEPLPQQQPIRDDASLHSLEMQPLAVEHPLQGEANRALALPASDHLPAPSAMRPPSQRRADPKPRGGASATPTSTSTKPRVNAISAANDILRAAERGSWRAALQGHPVAGFLLVLGSATSGALLLYFAV